MHAFVWCFCTKLYVNLLKSSFLHSYRRLQAESKNNWPLIYLQFSASNMLMKEREARWTVCFLGAAHA